jgi:RNase P subunit RPR2
MTTSAGFLIARGHGHYIESSCNRAPKGRQRESFVTLTCPNCGNDRNFQVKTLQMHVVHLEDGRVEVSEESRPAVLEVLCDECESALKFEEFEDTLRKEVLLTIGAR